MYTFMAILINLKTKIGIIIEMETCSYDKCSLTHLFKLVIPIVRNSTISNIY